MSVLKKVLEKARRERFGSKADEAARLTGWENHGYQYGMDREATPRPDDPQVHEPAVTDRQRAGRGVRRAAEERARGSQQRMGEAGQ